MLKVENERLYARLDKERDNWMSQYKSQPQLVNNYNHHINTNIF